MTFSQQLEKKKRHYTIKRSVLRHPAVHVVHPNAKYNLPLTEALLSASTLTVPIYTAMLSLWQENARVQRWGH